MHLPLRPIFRQSHPNFINVRTAYASKIWAQLTKNLLAKSSTKRFREYIVLFLMQFCILHFFIILLFLKNNSVKLYNNLKFNVFFSRYAQKTGEQDLFIGLILLFCTNFSLLVSYTFTFSGCFFLWLCIGFCFLLCNVLAGNIGFLTIIVDHSPVIIIALYINNFCSAF